MWSGLQHVSHELLLCTRYNTKRKEIADLFTFQNYVEMLASTTSNAL